MAVEDFLTQIIANKEAQAELNELTSTSRVSIWRLWAFIVAKISQALSELFDTHKAEIEGEFANVPFGSLLWYRAKALEFQKNDVLIHNDSNFTFGYESIDETKQVVKQCAVVADSGSVVFKVATKGDGNLLQPLDDVTAVQFAAYMNKIKYAGTNIQVINRTSDLLRLSIAVEFDAERDPDTVLAELKAAATAYVETLIFDGVFSLTAFIDALQTVKGIFEVVVISAEAKSSTATDWTDFEGEGRYRSVAGYMTFEDIENVFELLIHGS